MKKPNLQKLKKLKNKLTIKNILIVTTIILVIAGLTIASVGRNAAPGNPVYAIDRAIERMQVNITTNPKSQIELQLQFANERIMEQRESVNDADKTKYLMDEFILNIKQTSSLYSELSGDDKKDAEFALFVMNKNLATFRRTIEYRFGNTKDNDLRKPLIRAHRNLLAESDNVFDVAINHIDDETTAFDDFSRDYVKGMVRPIDEEIEYAQQDIGALVGQQATDDEVKQMTDKLNEARNIFFQNRDRVGNKNVKELYIEFEKVKAILSEINDDLVRISQRGLEPKATE